MSQNILIFLLVKWEDQQVKLAAFALIIGLIYLLARKIITFHIPLSIILAVTVFSGILWWSDPTKYADPLFHILTGGLAAWSNLYGD